MAPVCRYWCSPQPRKVVVAVTPAGQQFVAALGARLEGYTEPEPTQLAQDFETIAERLSAAARAIRRERHR